MESTRSSTTAIVQRDGQRVRLFTRNGHDWSARLSAVEAALRNHNSSFVLDGEAVLLGVDGVSDFNGLHSRKHDDEVEFYAFDMLVSDGEDLRKLPLSMRKTNLARLLARRPDGIFVSDFEQGEIGAGPVPPCLLDGSGGAGVKTSG
jgi:ATP-dependent DNA ligase